MTREEILIECLSMATDGILGRESVESRMTSFDGFVDGDVVRLGCLRAAMKTHGKLARISADATVVEAKKYLEIVRPTPKPTFKKQRGRQRN